MKRLIAILILLSAPFAEATVSLRICEQDGNTPFDQRPIMVGTKLVVYVDSNSAGPESWVGAIDLLKPVPEPAIPIGRLFGRGWEPNDYNDSHFAAAGHRAYVVDWENQDRQSFELSAAGANMVPGPWFVVDYNAVSIGDCTIKLMEYQGMQIVPVATQTFHQIANCDFNNDGYINFADFAELASYWMRTDCDELNNCEGTDLSLDGKVNLVDVMYFADYWLGGELQVDTQESNLLGGESMPMGSFASMQSVNLTQLSAVDSQAVGGEESMVLDGNLPALYLTCSNSNPDPNEEITVYIHSEEPLFCMDIGVSVIGDADITGAMSTADCNDFGWDPTWDSDPYYSFDGIHIIGVKWESDVAGVVGYLKLQYHGGEISVAINPEDSVAFNGDCVLVPLSDETLTIGHE